MQLTPEEIAEQREKWRKYKKNYITPVIQERWGKESPDNIVMEYCFTDGIVFCENIDHADAMVLKLKNLNSDLIQENSKYIMKITGDDEIGKAELENFTDPNIKISCNCSYKQINVNRCWFRNLWADRVG